MTPMRETDEFVTPEACERRHKESGDKYNVLYDLMNKINNRLYIDNGKKSMQSRLNEQEAMIKSIADNQRKMDGALTRLFWTIATPIIGGALWIFWMFIRFLISTGKI